MRYIYITLLYVSLLMMAACSSDSPDIIHSEEQKEMKFATSDISRAVTSNVNYDGSKFALFGDLKYSSNLIVKVFHNKEVGYAGGLWKYSDTQYWFPECEYSFVAVHPSSALKNVDDSQYAESKLTFSYAIPTTVTADGVMMDKGGTFDLLAATHRRMYDIGVNNTVSLKFAHLMSLVNLSPAFADNLMSNDDYILIHRIDFSGVASKSQFEITPAPRLSNNQTDDMIVNVSTQEKGNFAIVFDTPVKIKNHSGNVSLFDQADALIMLPNTFTADSDAKIDFTFSVNEETSMRHGTMPLNNQNWESGKSYNYKFLMERTGLKIDKCEINPWNEIRGENITVD